MFTPYILAAMLVVGTCLADQKLTLDDHSERPKQAPRESGVPSGHHQGSRRPAGFNLEELGLTSQAGQLPLNPRPMFDYPDLNPVEEESAGDEGHNEEPFESQDEEEIKNDYGSGPVKRLMSVSSSQEQHQVSLEERESQQDRFVDPFFSLATSEALSLDTVEHHQREETIIREEQENLKNHRPAEPEEKQYINENHPNLADEGFSNTNEEFSHTDEEFSHTDEGFSYTDEGFNNTDEGFNKTDEGFSHNQGDPLNQEPEKKEHPNPKENHINESEQELDETETETQLSGLEEPDVQDEPRVMETAEPRENSEHKPLDNSRHTDEDNSEHIPLDKSRHRDDDNLKHTDEDNSKHTPKDNSRHTHEENSEHIPIDNSRHTDEDNSEHTPKDNSKQTENDNSKHTDNDNSKHTTKDNSKHPTKNNSRYTSEEERLPAHLKNPLEEKSITSNHFPQEKSNGEEGSELFLLQESQDQYHHSSGPSQSSRHDDRLPRPSPSYRTPSSSAVVTTVDDRLPRPSPSSYRTPSSSAVVTTVDDRLPRPSPSYRTPSSSAVVTTVDDRLPRPSPSYRTPSSSAVVTTFDDRLPRPSPSYRTQPRPLIEGKRQRPSRPEDLLDNVIQDGPAERREALVPKYEDNIVNLEGDFEEEEEDDDKPDRLAVLLRDSHFTCVPRKDGYYADEELACEVFHYCQNKVKHSWLCPSGSSFHQVHLICMPRSEDNICDKSSKFHFVNEFLYKELDGEEGATKTYADRYYPEDFSQGLAKHDGEGVAKDNAPRFKSPPVAIDRHPQAYAGKPEEFIYDFEEESRDERPEFHDPRRLIQNSKPEFVNSRPAFQISGPEIQNQRTEFQNPKPNFHNPRPDFQNPGSEKRFPESKPQGTPHPGFQAAPTRLAFQGSPRVPSGGFQGLNTQGGPQNQGPRLPYYRPGRIQPFDARRRVSTL